LPERSLLQEPGIDPKSNGWVTGGYQFSKNPMALIFAIDNLEMTPSINLLASSPF